MAAVHDCQVLWRPPSDELRFLPEGPYPYGAKQLSWVGIQHGPTAKVGSLNVLNLVVRDNTTYPLPGRPGFAFPTNRDQVFVIGLERQMGLLHIGTGDWQPLVDGIDADVENTIVNDAVLFEQGVVLGTKDVDFSDKKAGLYFWRAGDGRLFQLRDDQICSNGKIIFGDAQQGYRLLDIDTPTRKIVAYDFDVQQGKVSNEQVAIDLDGLPGFPDGMIATPDQRSVIVAIYDPEAADVGEARQYNLESKQLEAVYRCEASPQVTCPALVELDGSVKLVLTTAAEHMPPSKQQRCLNAGCLFIADTPFDQFAAAPIFPWA